jgi:hypothetical protein
MILNGESCRGSTLLAKGVGIVGMLGQHIDFAHD